MPGNSIQELYKQIKDTRSSANGEDYQKYLQAMELLNTELHGLIEPGPDGWKLLDAERRHLVLAAQGGGALSGGQRTERHRFRRILYRRD